MYKFRLSRTMSAYSQKPDEETIKHDFIFNELEFTIDSFIDDVKKGYAFAYRFKFNRPFKTTDKKNTTFSSTKIIAFDIDHNPIPMYEHIEQMSFKPTIAYTTPQNKTLPYRFRLIYCFDEYITSIDEYTRIYYKLLKLNNIKKLKDDCMKSVAQYFNGNADKDIEVYKSEQIYKINEINELEPNKESIIQIKNKNDIQINPNDTNVVETDKYQQLKQKSINQIKIENDIQINPNDTNIIFDNVFLSDFYSMTRRAFLLKYNFFLLDAKRESELVEIDCRHSSYPSDYVRVPIKYRNRRLSKKHIRFKDGELRHKYIHIAALVFRKLNPSITAEQLLYLLVDEIYNNYDNTDRKFDQEYMIKLTKQVLNEPIELLNEMQMHDLPKYKVSKEFCASTFQSAIAVSNQIRREQHYKQIDQYFDPTKTQKANLEILHNNNVQCSIATLKRYIKYKKEKHYSIDDPHYIFELTKMPLQNKKK